MRESKVFRRCLRAALDAGNFLNHGSRLGSAVGFRLKNLPKLADTKAADGKTTLLQVIAAEVMKDGDEVLLADEMGGLMDPQLKVSHNEAAELISAAEQQLTEIRTFLENYVPVIEPRVLSIITEGPDVSSPAPAPTPVPTEVPIPAGLAAAAAPPPPPPSLSSIPPSAAAPLSLPTNVPAPAASSGKDKQASGSQPSSTGPEADTSSKGPGAGPLPSSTLVELSQPDTVVQDLKTPEGKISDEAPTDSFKELMTAELARLEAQLKSATAAQAQMRSGYEAMLAYFGENLNSTNSDTDFWAAISLFVERFAAVQRALLRERSEKEEREARRKQREEQQAGAAAASQMRKQKDASMREKRERMLRTPIPTPPGTHPPSESSSVKNGTLNPDTLALTSVYTIKGEQVIRQRAAGMTEEDGVEDPTLHQNSPVACLTEEHAGGTSPGTSTASSPVVGPSKGNTLVPEESGSGSSTFAAADDSEDRDMMVRNGRSRQRMLQHSLLGSPLRGVHEMVSSEPNNISDGHDNKDHKSAEVLPIHSHTVRKPGASGPSFGLKDMLAGVGMAAAAAARSRQSSEPGSISGDKELSSSLGAASRSPWITTASVDIPSEPAADRGAVVPARRNRMASLLSHLPLADSVNTPKITPGMLSSSTGVDSWTVSAITGTTSVRQSVSHLLSEPDEQGLVSPQAEQLINEAVEKALKSLVDDVQLWYLNL
ncbi:hypothetical protein CEUSTIGMA_g12955.t1 [Chlamydomonas eustigma]|uniref:FH2 domain-containing protein n=1 Tax=Chlamydomonas eustigma TaxID=1157962 RepID=A0A250XRG9_9CHLO|nr:hypothetical protein CEUSTIGMA_g12955.t1 [Chlamydomonas eustigma]|eukprot:GAX85539.1 hypothetical protein CEUSTIGMA_g12955.t1 [Chlamydomonas eustigma]